MLDNLLSIIGSSTSIHNDVMEDTMEVEESPLKTGIVLSKMNVALRLCLKLQIAPTTTSLVVIGLLTGLKFACAMAYFHQSILICHF